MPRAAKVKRVTKTPRPAKVRPVTRTPRPKAEPTAGHRQRPATLPPRRQLHRPGQERRQHGVVVAGRRGFLHALHGVWRRDRVAGGGHRRLVQEHPPDRVGAQRGLQRAPRAVGVPDQVDVAPGRLDDRGDVLGLADDVVRRPLGGGEPASAPVHDVDGEPLGQPAPHRAPRATVDRGAVRQHHRRAGADGLESDDAAVGRRDGAGVAAGVAHDRDVTRGRAATAGRR